MPQLVTWSLVIIEYLTDSRLLRVDHPPLLIFLFLSSTTTYLPTYLPNSSPLLSSSPLSSIPRLSSSPLLSILSFPPIGRFFTQHPVSFSRQSTIGRLRSPSIAFVPSSPSAGHSTIRRPSTLSSSSASLYLSLPLFRCLPFSSLPLQVRFTDLRIWLPPRPLRATSRRCNIPVRDMNNRNSC